MRDFFSNRTIGIDEAGRGPILGPMVLALVMVSEDKVPNLVALGVQDSKKFGSGPRAESIRNRLAGAIQKHVLWRSTLAEPATIDARVAKGELNLLEQELAVGMLSDLEENYGDPKEACIICDGASLFGPLRAQYPNLVALDRGEKTHVAVAAASILAKAIRDEEWRAIEAKYKGEFGPIAGGGYLNAGSRKFLKAYSAKYGELPPEARRSWRLREPL